MVLTDKSSTVTLNQRVQGSNPCAPTNHPNPLGRKLAGQSAHVLQRALRFCPRYEFDNRAHRTLARR